MSKILLGLSILLMAGAAVLGYMTQGKVKAQHVELDDKQRTIATQETKLSKTNADLKTANDQLASAKAESEGLNGQVAASKATADAATAAAATANKELEELKIKMAAMPVPGSTPAGEDLSAQLSETQKKLTDTEAALKEAQQVRDSMQDRVAKAEADAKSLADYKARREGSMAAQGLQGQVLAVNQAWSFVVLSIGDRQGVVANVEMLVTRGGEQIAKVKVSSVEPGSAVADIVPGSLKSGVTVQPGDTVIYKGS